VIAEAFFYRLPLWANLVVLGICAAVVVVVVLRARRSSR
jgi:hypothetical protein